MPPRPEHPSDSRSAPGQPASLEHLIIRPSWLGRGASPEVDKLNLAVGELLHGSSALNRAEACHQLGQLKATVGLFILCESGLSDRDTRVVEAAVSALRGINDPFVIEKLKSIMLADAGLSAMPAAKVLRGTKYEPTILWLANEARNPHYDFEAPALKEASIYALGQNTHPKAISALRFCAEKGKIPNIQAKAILALKECQHTDSMLWICNNGLVSKYDCIREASSAALQGTTDLAVMNWLMDNGVVHSSRPVRLASISALADTNCPRAISFLFNLLEHPDKDRGAAAEAMRALKQTKQAWAVPLLMERGLSKLNPLTRELSAQALGGTKNEAALKALFQLVVADPSPGVRCEAIHAAKHFGMEMPEASVVWESGLCDPSDLVRMAAATALTGTENKEALKMLCQVGIEEFRSNSVTYLVVAALRGTRDEATLSWLTEVGLESLSVPVREASASALTGTHYAPAVRKLMQKTIQDEVSSVRQAAVSALASIRLPDASEAICTYGLNDQDRIIREASAYALRGIEDPRIKQALTEIAQFDSCPPVRRAALEALSTD